MKKREYVILIAINIRINKNFCWTLFWEKNKLQKERKQNVLIYNIIFDCLSTQNNKHLNEKMLFFLTELNIYIEKKNH